MKGGSHSWWITPANESDEGGLLLGIAAILAALSGAFRFGFSLGYLFNKARWKRAERQSPLEAGSAWDKKDASPFLRTIISFDIF
jgi:hypothetical protein